MSAITHKCRRCETVYNTTKGNFKDLEKDLGLVTLGIRTNITVFELHRCKDGGIGIADIIGSSPPDPEITHSLEPLTE